MCFSAGASFTAGAIISAVGIATVREVKKPSQLTFSIIPLIFGLQQIAEGIIWLTLQNGGPVILQKISTSVFLTIADVIWPWMIPLSVLLIEENPKRRRIIRLFLGLGIFVSIYYAFFNFFFKVTPEIITCHIYYNTAIPKSLEIPVFLLYLSSTITPLFVSTVRRMYVFGILIFISVVASVIFYTKNVTSVWCFFAGVLSVIIYLIIRDLNKKREEVSQ